MAWTTPRTWVDGELEDAATLTTHLTRNIAQIDSAFISHSGALLIGAGASSLEQSPDGSPGDFLRVASGAVAWNQPLVSGAQSLTDDGVAATSTWEQWATEELDMGNPGEKVDFAAWVIGSVRFGAGAINVASTRIAYSTDGGSSWTQMTTPYSAIEGTPNHIEWQAVMVFVLVTGVTPTGTVQVRAESHQDAGTAGSVSWQDGQIIGMMWPA